MTPASLFGTISYRKASRFCRRETLNGVEIAVNAELRATISEVLAASQSACGCDPFIDEDDRGRVTITGCCPICVSTVWRCVDDWNPDPQPRQPVKRQAARQRRGGAMARTVLPAEPPWALAGVSGSGRAMQRLGGTTRGKGRF